MALLKARAHLAKAHGDHEDFLRLIDEATGLFRIAGQPRDAARTQGTRENAEPPSETARITSEAIRI
jgi:hypothetical protein